jgi:hypothetical protein
VGSSWGSSRNVRAYMTFDDHTLRAILTFLHDFMLDLLLALLSSTTRTAGALVP